MSVKDLYRIPEAMHPPVPLGDLRTDSLRRLRTVTQGRTRLVPASAIAEYVRLLEAEADRRLAA